MNLDANALLLQSKNNTLFVHRKTKKLVYVQVEKQDDKVRIKINYTDDGITLKPAEPEDDFISSLPETTGNILRDSLTIIKHFKKHGFKIVNTITATKKGIKFS